jgi:methylated-DNA-[protein]-cysteine S-methyltransferase
MTSSVYFYQDIPTPVGSMGIVVSERGLYSISWGSFDYKKLQATGARLEDDHHPLLQKTAVQLSEYFRGERKDFDVPLDSQGTPFQQMICHKQNLQRWKGQ